MRFNSHSGLEGQHAFLSPSNYHWLNYDDQKLAARFQSHRAAQRGTRLHDLAHEAIELDIKLSKGNRALASYVNDGIGYKMSVEVPLYYSPNCFGHADTLSFRRKKLRIHDLKTGITKVKFTQLEVYAALFCLEYAHDPFDLDMELRIYQNNDVMVHVPAPEAIEQIMETIIAFDQRIEEFRAEGM